MRFDCGPSGAIGSWETETSCFPKPWFWEHMFSNRSCPGPGDGVVVLCLHSCVPMLLETLPAYHFPPVSISNFNGKPFKLP